MNISGRATGKNKDQKHKNLQFEDVFHLLLLVDAPRTKSARPNRLAARHILLTQQKKTAHQIISDLQPPITITALMSLIGDYIKSFFINTGK
jgi:hypothetical protein